MRDDIASLRKEYMMATLDERSVSPNPFGQFEQWFQEALKSKLLEPTAMVLSSVDTGGQPFQRTVLLKSYDEAGFVFYTNYHSRKGQQMQENPKVSLLFPWYTLERQVVINGQAEKVATNESMQYFESRPRGSKIGAWVSNQSEVIASRDELEKKLEETQRKFEGLKIPLPDHWGGYRVVPSTIEFWQGRESRLHDRIFYERKKDRWAFCRLSP